MNKTIILIILIAAILGAGGAIYYLAHFNNLAAPVLVGKVPAPAEFSAAGNLIKNNPGLLTNVWYLNYEQPGAPAIDAVLVFDDKSVCVLAGAQAVCDESKLKRGDRVDVEGVTQTNGSILVKKLTTAQTQAKTQNVLLYYYNPNTDKDAAGNILCGKKGLAAVSREIPAAKTPIQDTINLLIKGELTVGEKKSGITTEFPLPGLALKGANLRDGVLTLEFLDPQNKTGGGSCRAAILWLQIEATAKQFKGVDQVRFLPETLFQP